MPEPVAVDLRDYVAFDQHRAVRSRVYETDLVAVDLLCLEPGQQLGARTHEDSDTVYTVIGGRAWVATDDSEVALEPLQAVLVPAGTTHGIRNDAADPLLVQTITALPVPVQSLRGTRSKDPATEPAANDNRTSPA
ncbi:MAG TPA: cupin domain-containing protein [Euzebyales bacterium]|nr:cupin domain-containing protein [Euzebyales bacterium]